MKLYGVAFSPYAQRCLMVARAKGHDLALLPPPPDGDWRSPAYRAINPLAKLPCLDDGGFILPESGPIADYLDAVLPGPSLWPADPRARARAAFAARMVDVEIGPGVSMLLGHALFGMGGEDAVARAMRRVARGLGAIAHFRDAAARWAQDDRFGHADAALMPMLAVCDRFGDPTAIRADPGLAAYRDRALGSDAGRRMAGEMAASFDAFLARPLAARGRIGQ